MSLILNSNEINQKPMRVFKFGGASVKDASGIKNIGNVLEKVGHKNVLVVISAMGKTTNALEAIVEQYQNQSPQLPVAIAQIKRYHFDILEALFDPSQQVVYEQIQGLFEELEVFLKRNKSPKYNYVYDQVISFGELISTTIVSHYLMQNGYANQWLDAREYIKTDSTFREGSVDWEATQMAIATGLQAHDLYVTQGFIGSDANNFTTTLGREGSDYSAAIFAYCLHAESVSIWKDVPGVLNGDPRVFEHTRLLHQISYEEAIELAFYGASVIHPKTLQPLQRKEIPLYVKSFLKPEAQGTIVRKGQRIDPQTPCFIIKQHQVLVSLSSLDFSFVAEHHISEIFELFHQYHIKVDLIQNSAISFSVCLDNKFKTFDSLLSRLKAKFEVIYERDVSLYTIRHYTPEAVASLEKNKEILLQQSTLETYQIVVKN